MMGEGMQSLGVCFVTDFRKSKSAPTMGRERRSLPTTSSRGGAKSISLSWRWNFVAMPPRTAMPSSFSRKSIWK
jgi:hypothetical protein